MDRSDALPYDAPLEAYRVQARQLLDALHAGDDEAAWCFKWEHPRFRGGSIEDVRAADLGLADAETLVARLYRFDSWNDLASYTDEVKQDGPVARFEAAVEAVISGDEGPLSAMLVETPDLVRARSARAHHATLLHYLGANGVEGARQRTPHNAVGIARMLLDAGAEVDALADLYDEKCTTMSMVVSSSHPAEAGLQLPLAETLLEYGAALDGAGTKWQSPVLTALIFGYPETAEALARQLREIESIVMAAGLGRVDDVTRFVPESDEDARHAAFALAAQHGRTEVVSVLLDAGEDPDRYNPDGYHAHATPLHHAALGGHMSVVRLLVERGARLDIRDTIYAATPLDWARHAGHDEIADYLNKQLKA